MPTHLLGIDVGTGGSKALIAGEDGTVAASVVTEYPLSTPRPLWAEQDPRAWWSATARSVRGALDRAGLAPEDIAAVGLTGQMHGLVLLDARGDVLRPAILWNDQRTAGECAEIHARLGRETVSKITGHPALPGFTAPKILWVRRHEPEVLAETVAALLPKDYVRFRLTGERATDVSDASGTTLLDVARRTWSAEMLEALEIPRAWLPEVRESPCPGAGVSAEGAAATGLLQGTPVVAGAGDQAAEAVGCGIVEPGRVSVTVGTSGVVFAATDAYRPDAEGRVHAYCHAVPGAWHLMGVMLSAGGSFRWYRDTLGGTTAAEARAEGVEPYDRLAEEAAGAPPGCEGLVFLPYLTGERTPHPDPHARGAFVGLTLRHARAHLTRAVMEGVVYGLMDSLELIRSLGVEVPRVRVSGGGARSGFWRQMMADVFGVEVATVNAGHGAAYGAVLLAGAGAGLFPDVARASADTVREMSVTRPGSAAGEYRASYGVYRDLYPALRGPFERLASSAASPSRRTSGGPHP